MESRSSSRSRRGNVLVKLRVIKGVLGAYDLLLNTPGVQMVERTQDICIFRVRIDNSVKEVAKAVDIGSGGNTKLVEYRRDAQR